MFSSEIKTIIYFVGKKAVLYSLPKWPFPSNNTIEFSNTLLVL